MMDMFDEKLKQALKPREDADIWLNQKILNSRMEEHPMKYGKIRNIPVFVAVVICILCLLSVGTVAAWKYLEPAIIANRVGDSKLSRAFAEGKGTVINETQSMGGFDITLLGIIAGADISIEAADGDLQQGMIYAAVAVANSDGSAIPDMSDMTTEDMERYAFLVSPLIQGCEPWNYNIFRFDGGRSSFVENGVLYLLASCDNVEMFADRNLYLCVQEGDFYDSEAYKYDAASGKIARNSSYQGVNALFCLPMDADRADAEAAEQYLKSLEEKKDFAGDDADADGEMSAAEQEIDAFANELADDPQKLEEKCRRLGETEQVLMPDRDGYVSYRWELEDGSAGSGKVFVKEFVEKAAAGEKQINNWSHSGTRESIHIEVFEQRADGTLTFVVYVPK